MEKPKLKVFISYSHNDESHINEFKKHLVPLKHNGFIEEWYDRKIEAGQDFQNTIDNNLENADIICLFISADFLASSACMKEKDIALSINKQKGISVIPIILSPSGWLEYKDLSKLLVIPTDGKPVTKFDDTNSAWQDVMKWLKDVINSEIYHKYIMLSPKFIDILEDAYLLSKSHPKKSILQLSDIFIYPSISVYDDLREF